MPLREPNRAEPEFGDCGKGRHGGCASGDGSCRAIHRDLAAMNPQAAARPIEKGDHHWPARIGVRKGISQFGPATRRERHWA